MPKGIQLAKHITGKNPVQVEAPSVTERWCETIHKGKVQPQQEGGAAGGSADSSFRPARPR